MLERPECRQTFASAPSAVGAVTFDSKPWEGGKGEGEGQRRASKILNRCRCFFSEQKAEKSAAAGYVLQCVTSNII